MNETSYSMASIESFCARFWQGHRLYITPMSYPVTFTTLAQNTTQTGTINIQANADFVLLELAFRANIGAAQTESTVTATFIRALITDTGSSEQFTNSAVDLETWASNSQRMRPLPYPRIIQGRSALSIQVTNYSPAAESYTFDLVLHGVHVRAYTDQR